MNLNLTISNIDPSLLADINAEWLEQKGASIGKTSSAIDAVTTSISVTVDQSGLSSQQDLPAVGETVLIDGEPMAITASSGMTLTLERNVFPMALLAEHASGAVIYPLLSPSAFAKFNNEAVRPWMLQILQRRGDKSVTLGASVTGSVS